jgi:hypothetical protein
VIDVAARIVADARLPGVRLSQAGLARQLRAEGYSIANDRLLALAIDLWWTSSEAALL